MKKQILCAMMALATLLAVTASESFAGAVGGPKWDIDSVSAGSSDSYTVSFRGGELASILVDGDGSTDLDLFVYDANGNLVAVDNDNTDTCLATFVPRWTGSFRIVIVNRGYVYNDYRITTN